MLRMDEVEIYQIDAHVNDIVAELNAGVSDVNDMTVENTTDERNDDDVADDGENVEVVNNNWRGQWKWNGYSEKKLEKENQKLRERLYKINAENATWYEDHGLLD